MTQCLMDIQKWQGSSIFIILSKIELILDIVEFVGISTAVDVFRICADIFDNRFLEQWVIHLLFLPPWIFWDDAVSVRWVWNCYIADEDVYTGEQLGGS